MRSIQELQKCSPSVEEMFKEIDVRKLLISQMVGTLYPGILSGEIATLYHMITKKRME